MTFTFKKTLTILFFVAVGLIASSQSQLVSGTSPKDIEMRRQQEIIMRSQEEILQKSAEVPCDIMMSLVHQMCAGMYDEEASEMLRAECVTIKLSDPMTPLIEIIPEDCKEGKIP